MSKKSQNQDVFDRNGFLKVAEFFTLAEVNQVRAELDRFIEKDVPNLPSEHVFYEDVLDPTTLKQIQQLQTHDPHFRALMVDSKTQSLAEEIMKGPVVPKNLQYFNKAPLVAKPTPAHQDGYYFKLEPCKAVTLWLALDEVDEENGCVHYVRASHLAGLRPHGATNTLGFSQGLSSSNEFPGSADDVACPAHPGDLLAHHALTIHWAGSNQSPTRTRRALGFIYYAQSAYEDTDAHEAYQRKLAVELKQAGRL